ncbi:CRISPR-associated helicase Cas3' [Heliobacterium undosum]|uniref:CRISPR-associated helicase Cas3 n=1 Tax=Heliomicrobium undosum TaxID=121734 RepID=A0A845L577_9FIRM|nr:CRISPR-associated helicase Cas3' [Heliomicrobium undosum]MZP28928.1 CRISPR-associated helicase Cas3' [Heliomicrobium undosum]
MFGLDYEGFFSYITGHDPYPFQSRFACLERWPDTIELPTGCGKTETAVLRWLWKTITATKSSEQPSPHRLVYCLPMRILVEQTTQRISRWLDNYESYIKKSGLTGVEKPYLITLMGGVEYKRWDIEPEKPGVIIGTQDMLLSRALNRGYAISRYRWPIEFGLLNNDCLWVMDETQLMGSAVTTSAQLNAFRKNFKTFGDCHTVWMSATLQPDCLKTVDHPQPPTEQHFSLSPDDFANEILSERIHAGKEVKELKLSVPTNNAKYPSALAEAILRVHRERQRTIIIMNTVKRAQMLYESLTGVQQKSNRTRKKSDAVQSQMPDTVLIHAQMRHPERNAALQRILSFKAGEENSPGQMSHGQIIVSTQVIEAGIDISSSVLITELAPWMNIVQRMGRLNRDGKSRDAQLFWIDVADKHSAPYAPEAIQRSRRILQAINGEMVTSTSLPEASPEEELALDVLRKQDLLDLFNTTADLSGNDIDVSRFVRNTKNGDVFFCWRSLNRQPPSPDIPRPLHQELCPVVIHEAQTFIKDHVGHAWVWDLLDREWRSYRPHDLYPGQVILIDAEAGGYDRSLGWSPQKTEPVPVVQINDIHPNESSGDDHYSFQKQWLSLADHSADVARHATRLLQSLDLPDLETYHPDIYAAAICHDIGKGHETFQTTLLSDLGDSEKGERLGTIWAKSPCPPKHHQRPHFRHEFASLLMLLAHDSIQVPNPNGHEPLSISDLSRYLVASHHGHVRIGIQSYPLPQRERASGREHMILGIQDGDSVPPVDLGFPFPATTLSLDWASLGGPDEERPSWLMRSLTLLDRLGPFRLAFLEALLRAADIRASMSVEGETCSVNA